MTADPRGGERRFTPRRAGRADWGMAIATVARQYGLGFLPVKPGQYDFAVPRARLARLAVRRFQELLADPGVRARLAGMGFVLG